MTDPCKFEPDILILKNDLPKIEATLINKIDDNKSIVLAQHRETKQSIDQLTKMIQGRDPANPGLLTQVILNQKSISRLWWFNSAIMGALLALLAKAFLL